MKKVHSILVLPNRQVRTSPNHTFCQDCSLLIKSSKPVDPSQISDEISRIRYSSTDLELNTFLPSPARLLLLMRVKTSVFYSVVQYPTITSPELKLLDQIDTPSQQLAVDLILAGFYLERSGG